MKICKINHAPIARLTAFLMILFVMSDLVPQTATSTASESGKLVQEGKALYANGNYNEALLKFLEALTKAASIQDKAEAQFNLSLVHHALGNKEKAKEYLEGLFRILPNYSIVEANYPQGYVDLIKQVKGSTATPEWKGKPGKEKPARKKTIWFVIGGVVATAGGIAIYLLTRPPKFGDIAVASDPAGAKAYLDGTDTGKITNCSLTNVSTGKHRLLLVLENYGKWEGDVEVKGGQTANISCKLAAFKYEFVTKWGSRGGGDGQFWNLEGIEVDSSGYVFVVDSSFYARTQKFTSNGSFVTSWGSEGSRDGQFYYPTGIAIDNLGYVFVADTYNSRIQKFTSNGSFVTKWGSFGSGDGQFYSHYGVAADNSGYIYITDSGNSRIQKFTSNGSFVTKWGSKGSGDGQFNFPCGIAVDNSGNVYVADGYNYRIQKFTSNGSFITKWGSQGSGDGQFYYPRDIAVDNLGYVFVVEMYNSRIQKFTSNGLFVTKWGSQGSGDGQLYNPSGISVDNPGYVFVADTINCRIQKFRITSETQAAAITTYSSISGMRDSLTEHTSIRPSLKSLDETDRHEMRLGPRNKKDIK